MTIVEIIPAKVDNPIEDIAGCFANIREVTAIIRTTAEKKIALL